MPKLKKSSVAAAQIRARMAYFEISCADLAEAMDLSYLQMYRRLKGGLTADQFMAATQALDRIVQAKQEEVIVNAD